MSDKVNSLSVHAERFFIRLIMKADDHGVFHADTRLLKANLYPLLLDSIREADLVRWTADCRKAGLVVLYESEGKKYMQILDFRQRLDKAKSKYPLPTAADSREIVNEFPAELEQEVEAERNRANALVALGDPGDGRKKREMYGDVQKSCTNLGPVEIWNKVKGFIQDEKPSFIDPYVDAWNIFAVNPRVNLPKVEAISDTRRKKFRTRIAEPSFDFLKVLEGIKNSAHLRGTNDRGWTASFDWIIENDKNYLKILEGNYN